MFELICTSVPQGLFEGSSGFCTVACTNGMPPHLISALEAIGAAEPDGGVPVLLAYRRVHCGGVVYPVMTRTVSGGRDHNGSPGKTVHHLIFASDDELNYCPGEAFGVLCCEENFIGSWEKEPACLPVRKGLVSRKRVIRRAGNWELVAGDAGWAGVIAEYFREDPEKTVYLIFDSTQIEPENLLVLFNEISDLFPEKERKKFTYSTFCCGEFHDCDCFLQAVPADDPAAAELCAGMGERCLILDAAGVIPEKYAASPLVDLARNRKTERVSRRNPVVEDEDFINDVEEKTEPHPEISRKKFPVPLLITFLLLLLILLGVLLLVPRRSSGNPEGIEVLQENLQID